MIESAAPRAERRPVVTVYHGREKIDDYAWLRADNWQQVMRDPSVLPADIRAVLDAENAHASAMLADTEALQATLVSEMRGRILEDDASVPKPDGPFAYASRHRQGGQHPLFVRTPRQGGAESILIDGDALAKGKAFFRFAGITHSPDHRLVAFAADEAGSELATIRVRDIATGADLADVVPDTTGAVVFGSDSSHFYYVRLDANHRPASVHRHVLGAPVDSDVTVYAENDPGFFVSIDETQTGRFLVISAHDHETSECHLLDLTDPAGTPRLIAAREPFVQYDVEHHPDLGGIDRLVIRTNALGAEDFRLMTAPLAAPGRENWRELAPYRGGVFLIGYQVLRGHLVRLEREDGLPRLVVRDLADGREDVIGFAEAAFSLGLDPGFEFDTTILRFVYSSPATPSETWDIDLATGERTLRKRQVVPSGHDPARYVVERLMAPTADGETVPVSLIRLATTPVDGSAPCLLYGYGAYGMSMPANFSTARLSLVDRGFIHAVAHIRGGTEKGWRWYKDGKLARKPNTFRDFIAAGEHLVARGYTQPDRIVAQGGSAGGMLMGAVANLRPDLFAGIIAEVPFVDVLNTMLDDTLPLTPPEWPEWGNPIESAEAYETIAAYCPYTNVTAQDYPAILAVGGLTDPRVTYWEPAKWVAKLRATRTNDTLLLLRTNMEAGHGGAAGRFDRLKEVALSYAFALKVTGRALA